MFLCLLEHPVSIPVIAREQGWSPSDGYQLSSTLRLKQRKEKLIMSRYVTEYIEYMNSSLHAFSPTRYWQSSCSHLVSHQESSLFWQLAQRMGKDGLVACFCMLAYYGFGEWESELCFRSLWYGTSVKQVLSSTFELCIPRTSTDTASFRVQKGLTGSYCLIIISMYRCPSITSAILFCLLILQEGQSGLEYVAFNCAEASKVATCLNDEWACCSLLFLIQCDITEPLLYVKKWRTCAFYHRQWHAVVGAI